MKLSSAGYQSHLRGIETALFGKPVAVVRTINRTLEELKPATSRGYLVLIFTINRTLEELKRLYRRGCPADKISINRTLEELKLVLELVNIGWKDAINRTLEELKRCGRFALHQQLYLSIAP